MKWKNIGFKGKAGVVLFTGVVFSAALIWYGVSAVNLVVEEGQVWSDYNRTATATSQQMNIINENLGYGGFIHHFKNYILRGDAKYLELLDIDRTQLEQAISAYRELDISDRERAALARLSAVVEEYVRNAQAARQAFAQGQDSASVDRSVMISDGPALGALTTLSGAALQRSRQSENDTQAWLKRTVAYLSWGLFIVPLVLLSAAVMVRFLWQALRASRTAERAQKEVETLLQTAPDAMLTVDKSGTIVRANQQAQRLFGYSIPDLCAMTIEELVPEAQRADHARHRDAYFQAPSERSMASGLKLVGVTRDGREVPLEITLSTVVQDSGVFATATIRDISDRLAAEQKVRENEERLSLSQEIADVGTWDWDVQSGKLIWSPQIYKILGVTPDQLAPSYENFLSMVHPQDRDNVRTVVRAALQDGKTYEVEHRLLLPSGEERSVHSRGRVYRNDQGAAVRMIGVVLDITERKAFVTALEDAKAEADRANKSKSMFLANMSHEIRTPMNAILGMGHLVQKTDLNPQQSDYLNKIMGATRSLLTIINDILDFSKIEADKFDLDHTSFSLGDVLQGIADVMGGAVEDKKLEVMFSTGQDVPDALIGDPLRLEQVLINLVGNAVKFTETGEIVVRTALLDLAADNRVVLQFSVRDTGIGMAEEHSQALFDPFHQGDTSTTRRFGGTGLGLSISQSLVHMMGGDIHVDSVPGHGSTFTFTVKFDLNPDATVVNEVPANMKACRVLIVDDNQTSCEIISEMMSSFGCQSTSVTSGEAALSELKRAKNAPEPSYNVVLMDWGMDGLDGLETTQLMRADSQFPTTPVIMMVTAYGRDQLLDRVGEVGLDGFLLKPVTPSALFDAIVNVLGLSVLDRKNSTDDGPGFSQNCDPVETNLSGARVLVVEDNSINQQVVQEILQAAQATVEIVDHGGQACDMICRDGKAFDVVLMDLHMPVMDGYEATREIRREFSAQELPIIAVTANAMRDERQKCLDAGMNDYITKPVDVDVLYSTVAEWLKPLQQPQNPPGPPKKTTRSVRDISVDAMTLPPTLDGFDLVEGLDRMMGRAELYLKFLCKMVDDLADNADQVREHLRIGDRDAAHRVAHTAKGVAGNLSAADLYAAATLLSDALKDGDESPDGALDRFEVELNRAVAAVRSLYVAGAPDT